MKKILLFTVLLLLIINIFADLSKVIANTKVTKLKQFSNQLRDNYLRKHAEALERAKQLNIPIKIENDNILMELQTFRSDGVPQYYRTTNVNAAKTISTDHVHSGGSAGLNLDGSGFLIREWDGGGVRSTHQELTGRVLNGDGTTGTHYHSTHVAGTMIASGVQANAKGMAYQANLKFFDWNSDTAEMAAEAANGMLLSNHSYGFGRGWNWNE